MHEAHKFIELMSPRWLSLQSNSGVKVFGVIAQSNLHVILNHVSGEKTVMG